MAFSKKKKRRYQHKDKCSCVLFCFILFWDSISLCSPGWLQTHYVAQAGHKLLVLLLFSLLCAGITVVYHHASKILFLKCLLSMGTLWSNNCTKRFISKRKEYICSPKDIHKNVHRSFTYDRKNWKIQIFIGRRVDKYTILYSQNGINIL